MNKKQYNNVIENTLKYEQSAQTDDSLATARTIFNNMGVALPQGDIKTVYETISTDNYMGWKSCTMKEAQEAADKGTAAIGISEDRIVVLSATDEEQPVSQTATVMTLDENTSAFAVEGMQYYSYSNDTTTLIKENVTIKKDGNFNKVVFESTGKVWRCINCDIIYNDFYNTNSVLINRSNHNFFTYFDENNVLNSNTTPKGYTDDEIKLLYAIDPYGVAAYVQRYADEVYNGLSGTLAYKDRIFRLLFNREPKYFARTIDGTWYEVDDYEEINDVLSESETIFGMHPIYDWHTFFEILGVCSSILNMVFLTNFFTSTIAGTIISKTVKTGLLIVSGMESVLRREFGSYVAGNAFEKAMEKTSLEWALNFVSLYDSLDDLANAMNLDLNFNKQIIDYCACQTGYNVLFELKNGTIHNLNNVCGMLD